LSSSDKEVGDHLALTLNGHQPPPLEPVAVPQALVGPSGDLDVQPGTPCDSIRLAVFTVSVDVNSTVRPSAVVNCTLGW
jgi:hypothetical protein